MFWGKKDNEKSLPELPPLKPSRPFEMPKREIPEEPERQALPAFPEPEEEEKEELPELPAKFRLPKIRTIEQVPEKRMTSELSAGKEDVYVKIDKFHSARRALNSARDKLAEIDELMKKIRETKMREEQELSSWEKEIDTIKTKVEDVTKNIFEKVE
jgi:predicted  nucleic acid-binding Zn-ribbon protein